jgi:hypothetical protein
LLAAAGGVDAVATAAAAGDEVEAAGRGVSHRSHTLIVVALMSVHTTHVHSCDIVSCVRARVSRRVNGDCSPTGSQEARETDGVMAQTSTIGAFAGHRTNTAHV